MALHDPVLQELAELFGIATEFWDWKGRRRQIADTTVTAILAALGVDASSPEAAASAAERQRNRDWSRSLPPCLVVEEGQSGFVNVHVRAGHPATVDIVLEDGSTRSAHQVDNWAEPRVIDDVRIGEATFKLPNDLPLGYHTLRLNSQGRDATGRLIITPSYLGLPPAMGASRVWGYQTQLYSVRSRASWGIGDLQDLSDLAIWSATQQGAGYVLVSPLHAAQAIEPLENSPYLPCSRRQINPLYIRPEAVEEYAQLARADQDLIEELKRPLVADLPTATGLRRDQAWAAKRQALRLVYSQPLRPVRAMAFQHYRETQGQPLRDFAIWSVLSAHLGPDWRAWPEPYRSSRTDEVADFVSQHVDEIEFIEWQQWVADEQLSRAQQQARDAGMTVGIVTDLAVGVNALGADTWMLADVYAKGVSVGAPPDSYNQIGQDWGQPPWRPDRLEELGYEPFASMVRAVLRHAGGLRLDHILGLFRQWWVPAGASAAEGSYVRCNHEAMVGIVILEAHRAQALVVGEDLGTVEPWVRDYLHRRGVLGTSVFWFEGDKNGLPLAPEKWRELCMASVTTHDLPPSAGYLALDHVRLRHDLGISTEPLDLELAEAEREHQAWIEHLRERGAFELPDGVEGVADPVETQVLALHHYLTWTRSRVLNAALVDAVGERRTQNQPGTVDEYPNWRVPLSGQDGQVLLLEDVYRMARPMRLAAVMTGADSVREPWQG